MDTIKQSRKALKQELGQYEWKNGEHEHDIIIDAVDDCSQVDKSRRGIVLIHR